MIKETGTNWNQMLRMSNFPTPESAFDEWKFDVEICPLAISNRISTIPMHIQNLLKIH